MEGPPIILTRIPDSQRRMSCTSQLFTRLDKNTTSRDLKTSKLPRAFPHSISKHTLQNSKQNMSYQSYLHKIKAALKTDEKQMASGYLLSLRKQYDKMSKNIKQQSTGINVMKKEIEFMRDRVKNQTDHLHNSQNRVQFLKKELQNMEIKQEEARMETKMLEHLIWRMKHDQLQYKSQCHSKELKLKDTKKHLKLKQDEILQWDDSIHKIFEQMNKMKEDYHKNCQERQLKFQDYKTHVIDLQEQEKFEKERRERTFELLSMESNDIMDAKNVVLRDVLLSNKVLDKLLESKINDLLGNYQELQNSYHLIKTQTNLADPQLLAKKFFSYSQNLEEITSAIRCYEQKQQKLVQRNKELKQLQNQKLIKRLEEQKGQPSSTKQIEQLKQTLIQESLEKEMVVKKIKMWFDKIYDSVGCRKFADVGISEQINQICNEAIKKANQIKNRPEGKIQKFQSPAMILKKNIMRQFTSEDEKRRSEAQQVNESNIFENIYLNYQRKQVKKNQFQIKMQSKPVKQ